MNSFAAAAEKKALDASSEKSFVRPSVGPSKC